MQTISNAAMAACIVEYRDNTPGVADIVAASSEPLRAMAYEYLGERVASDLDGTALWCELMDELELVY